MARRATFGWLVPVFALLMGCAGAGQASPPRVPEVVTAVVPLSSAPTVGGSVYVTVSVATLWVRLGMNRAVDAPAVANPVRMSTWLSAMTTSQELGLVGRVETQALYGARLLVTEVRPHWLHVVVPSQPTRRDARGYPGWVPRRQVTTSAPRRTVQVATVVTRLATLRSPTGAIAPLRVSIGTVLPVVSVGATQTTVFSPTGAQLTVSNSSVVVRRRGVAALSLTAAGVMRTAHLFDGVQYLWGGRSGFAVDCSGFTGLVYAVHGVRLPRDANDQATWGHPVSIGAQRVADLLFFRRGSGIGHVAFYAGAGRMLQAPRTGTVVGTAWVSSGGILAAVRRFI